MRKSTIVGLASLLIGTVIAAVVFVPIVLEAMFPPACIQESQALASDVAGMVSEAAVSAFLTACERDIQAGTLAETNCVVPWLSEPTNPRRRFSHISKMKGTNLCVTATFSSDSSNLNHITFSKDPKAHQTGRLGKFAYAVRVWTNCSVTVNNWGK